MKLTKVKFIVATMLFAGTVGAVIQFLPDSESERRVNTAAANSATKHWALDKQQSTSVPTSRETITLKQIQSKLPGSVPIQNSELEESIEVEGSNLDVPIDNVHAQRLPSGSYATPDRIDSVIASFDTGVVTREDAWDLQILKAQRFVGAEDLTRLQVALTSAVRGGRVTHECAYALRC